VPAGKLEELAKDPGVTRITLDAPMRSLDEKRERERNEQRDRDDDRQKQTQAAPRGEGQRARASEPVTEPNPHCRPPAGRASLKDAKPETGAPDVRRLGTVYPLAVCAADLWGGKQGIRGDHVTVAVLDSGIDLEHRDFNDVTVGTVQGSSRVLERLTKSTGRQGEDDNGHGTFVAGIIAGRGFGDPTRLEDDGKYVGIAPDVDVVSVKVSDGQGVARVSQVIDAIEWAVENRDRHHIRVISLALVSSVPESYKTSLLSAAVQLAWSTA
jgi:serine protease AprX